MREFFEGAEKKIELVVSSGVSSLRQRGHAFWRRLVEAAGAVVLSRMSSCDCDAYLLSESSLFVFDRRFVLITCGRTTLVPAVELFLDEFPASSIEMLLYERKNEAFPHAQESSFFDDARRFNVRLPGRAFLFGDAESHHLQLFHIDCDEAPDQNEPCLEILMYDLSPAVRDVFFEGPCHTSELISEGTGVHGILEGYEIDDHVFEPVGYSLNGLCGDRYFSIHVTPQAIGSYVSFETNHRFRDQAELDACVARVFDVFQPGAVDVVSFDSELTVRTEPFGFALRRSVEEQLPCGYHVTFSHAYRPSRGTVAASEIALERLSELELGP